MTRTALLTGFTGQDGSYLSELLLSKGYRVVAFVRALPDLAHAAIRAEPPRRPTRQHFGSSTHLVSQVESHIFHEASLGDWERLMDATQPDEIYHLGAHSSVGDSWIDPLHVNHANIDLTTTLLETMRRCSPRSKLFFACSSEVFGTANVGALNEHSAMQPCTPYGISKAAGHWLVQSYRQKYGLFACSGILFNHESPRRPENFVSRKITRAAAKIKLGQASTLELGNLAACRDWGYAKDFVEAMWRSLQGDTAEDYVIGTGKLESVQTFVELAFSQVGLDWRKYVRVNPTLVRPNDAKHVYADASKAARILNWQPTTSLEQIAEIMVQSDLEMLSQSSFNSRAA